MPQAWTNALFGGALIGLSALILLLFLGRIAGVSGITFTALTEREGRAWRLSFLGGLFMGGALLRYGAPIVFAASAVPGLPIVAFAGLLVGFGVTLGSGCTSGHGVCGVSRLSPRSLAATMIFVLVGMVSASLFHGESP